MSRPTAREFAVRWWQFRPTSTGVIVITIGSALLNALLGWSIWVSVTVVLALWATASAGFAALEFWNEGFDDEPSASPEAGNP